jgi:hypothetical protein
MEVFLDLLREIKKIILSIKDLIIKFIMIMVSMFLMIDGPNIIEDSSNLNTFSIGSCFHPRTLIKLRNGEYCQMQDLAVGEELEDGSKVFAVLKVDNYKHEPLYRIKYSDSDINDKAKYIYVTGEHFIFDTKENKWIQVKNYLGAELQDDINSNWFSCLITTSHKIKIGEHLFWDWEDDELKTKL